MVGLKGILAKNKNQAVYLTLILEYIDKLYSVLGVTIPMKIVMYFELFI